MQQFLWVTAPAKINLTLNVLGKRSDGYHELETVMHKVNLSDRLRFQPASGIKVSGNDDSLDWGSSNLVYKAALLILNRYSPHLGVDIYVEKNIPTGAGLAGGSTDAAAALTGINNLYTLNVSPENMFEMAKSLGSDVPFCLPSGPSTALAKGRGEILTPLPLGEPLALVIIKPDFSLSTSEIYRRFNSDNASRHADTGAFINAVKSGSLKDMACAMENELEAVSVLDYPIIASIKRHLESTGALKALMTGSGPCVFGLFADTASAGKAYAILAETYNTIFAVSSYF
ncbi:MAG: 4-(cytidine 5'-diphospho)-2-C-methyl-D-erythritol kinase [Syntrophomonadaceae bacterium]|nr:4-(cytidine 5'-diphospho)-2-C-methyl-D-erythritol kinase [Syntrophomonadaceae bacterium]